MEAMAVEKAVVATDVNGVRELMGDDKTGIIVPPCDAGALAEAVEKLIDQPRLLKECGWNGMERVKQSFTLSRMLDELEAYFTEKLNGKSS
jgi:glycosyltransferase involved in cell wall biosynthesis